MHNSGVGGVPGKKLEEVFYELRLRLRRFIWIWRKSLVDSNIKIFSGVLDLWPVIGPCAIDSVRDTSTGMFFGREWAGRKRPPSSMVR
jgi:hypothetical protein